MPKCEFILREPLDSVLWLVGKVSIQADTIFNFSRGGSKHD